MLFCVLVIIITHHSPTITEHMWVMSYVNNVASVQAKIDLRISQYFSYGFQHISEWALQEWQADLLCSILMFM